MEDQAILTIIISTLNNRIANLKKAVRIKSEWLKYLIVHQNPKNIEIPRFLLREDIKIIESNSLGLSNSRNLGIKNCTTKYALIGDDDVEYIEEGINEVLKIIRNSKADLLTFKIKTPHAQSAYKIYPEKEYTLEFMKHYISSIEMCINVETLKNNNLCFDQRFGLGTFLKKGEETILLYDIIKQELYCKYYPIEIVIHPYESSGKKERNMKYNYFFLGAFNERIHIKAITINYGDNKYINKIYYKLGKMYIKVTNFI